MSVFTLPDRRRELVAVESRLKADVETAHAAFRAVRACLPPGEHPNKGPTFMSWLIAHRKWLHAYEKLSRIKSLSAN